MDSVTVNKCCAICENNRNKDKCIMTKIYEAAENLGYNDEVYIASFKNCCKDFSLNVQFETKPDEIVYGRLFPQRDKDC